MRTVEAFRRSLYLSQRRIGDAQALARGPFTYTRRVARRTLVRDLFRLLR